MTLGDAHSRVWCLYLEKKFLRLGKYGISDNSGHYFKTRGFVQYLKCNFIRVKNVFHKLQRRNENMACDQLCSSVKSDVMQDDFTKEGKCISNVVWCMHFLTYYLYLHSVLIFFIGVDWNMNNKLANRLKVDQYLELNIYCLHQQMHLYIV